MKARPFQIVGAPPAAVSMIQGEGKKRVLAYVRVSSVRETRQQHSPAVQTQIIRDYCKRNGLDNVEIMQERESAKDIRGRPVFQKILAMCEAGQVSDLIVQDISRAFRDKREAFNTLYDLEQIDVQVHSAVQAGPRHKDRSSSEEMGEDFQILMDHHMRRQIAEKTKRVKWANESVAEVDKDLNPAMRNYYDQGKLVSGKRPYGYKFSRSASLAPRLADGRRRRVFIRNEETYPTLLLIHQLHADGLGWMRICHELFRREIPAPDGKRGWGIQQISKLLKRGYI